MKYTVPLDVIFVIFIGPLPTDRHDTLSWVRGDYILGLVDRLVLLGRIAEVEYTAHILTKVRLTLICVMNPPLGEMQYLRFCTKCNASSHESP